ncbi:MAG: DUF1861 family protein [bacterium]
MILSSELLRFHGPDVEGLDVYNPTAPFDDHGVRTLAARVESRTSETDSHIFFFTETKKGWERITGSPSFPLQDPFISRVHGEFVFGGVRYPVENNSWKTLFYRGNTVHDLKLFAEGPLTMKDIRLLELDDGRIGVFTRPMGEIGGRGKIGFTILARLADLATADLVHAPLIPGQFGDDTWGGANEVRLLAPGLVGVLGHAAEFSTDERENQLKHYRATAFVWDVASRKATPMRVIAERKDFPKAVAKREPELHDVVISGGLVPLADGRVQFYCGLSDTVCGCAIMDNPF